MRHNRFSGQRKLVAVAALVSAAPFAGASAQRQAAPPPRLMVTTFAASEPGLGVQAAEALRSRVTKDMDERKLQVITKKDIDATLAASGYSTTESLASNDARALAVLLRADEYIEGTAIKSPAGVKVEARLVLARDNTIQQPLPPIEARNLDQAAQAISKNYQTARAQLEGERSCANLFRDGKYKEAEQAARQALQKYPTGTIAAVCLGNAMNAQKQTDSVLAVAQRILATDPRNISALRWAADIYQERKDPRAIEALVSLLAANPSDEKLRDQVLNDLARSGRYDLAFPIVAEGLKNNPGDPKFLRLAWLIYLGGQKYDLAYQAGEELIRADTAAADSSYFIRTSGALAAQNNYQKAVEVLTQGISKFPNSATLYVRRGAANQKVGNNQAALADLQKATSINPKVENGCVQVALVQSAMNQAADAILTTLRNCGSNGGDKHTVAQVALAEGQKAYKAGNASKNRADFQRGIEFFKFSDSIEPSSDAKFLWGVSAFSIGQSAITEAQGTKSCSLARMAKDNFTVAQENVPAGLQSYAEAAKQILTALPQFTVPTDDMIKRFCK